MRFRRLDEHSVALIELNLLLGELLRQIPASALPGDSHTAEDRLYSSPSEEPEPEFAADWQEYVQPELQQQFYSALETVRADLADFVPDPAEEEQTLLIPIAHLDAWLSALNQARLVLAARHEVTEQDLDDIPDHGDARALAIFQIYVYGIIQEWIIHELE